MRGGGGLTCGGGLCAALAGRSFFQLFAGQFDINFQPHCEKLYKFQPCFILPHPTLPLPSQRIGRREKIMKITL